MSDKLERTTTLKIGENAISRMIVSGYNTGSGNYNDFFIPVNVGGMTVTGVSVGEGSGFIFQGGKYSLPASPRTSFTIVDVTPLGIYCEYHYPATQPITISTTNLLRDIVITCA